MLLMHSIAALPSTFDSSHLWNRNTQTKSSHKICIAFLMSKMCLFNFAMNACIDYPEQRGGRHDPKIPLANPNKAAMPYKSDRISFNHKWHSIWIALMPMVLANIMQLHWHKRYIYARASNLLLVFWLQYNWQTRQVMRALELTKKLVIKAVWVDFCRM